MMSLHKKDRQKEGSVHKYPRGPFIFTFMMIIQFAVISFIMLALVILASTLYDMIAVKKYVEKQHSYYEKQEDFYLNHLCMEYKNLNLVMADYMQEDMSLEELSEIVENVNGVGSERYIILDQEGQVVYPQNWEGSPLSDWEMDRLLKDQTWLVRDDEKGSRLYYSGGLPKGQWILAMTDDNEKIEDLLDHRIDWRAQCENVKLGEGGVVIPISKSSGTQYYYPNNMASLEDAKAVVGSKNDYTGLFELDQVIYMISSRKMADGDTLLLALYPVKEIFTMVGGTTLIATVIFAIAMGIMLIYTLTMIRLKKKGERVYRWKKLPGGFFYDRRAGRQMLIYSSLALTLILIMTLYSQSLIGLSRNTAMASRQLEQVAEAYDQAYEDGDELKDYIDKKRQSLLRMLLLENVDRQGQERELVNLRDYSDNIYSVSFFDVKGNLLATTDPDTKTVDKEENKDINEVRQGISNDLIYISDLKGGEGIPSYYNMAMVVQNNNKSTGFMVLKVGENQLPEILDECLLKDELLSVRASNGGIAFAIDRESGVISFDHDASLTGKEAIKYGMEEDEIKGGFSGYLELGGVKKYAVSVAVENQYIYLVMEKWEMMINRMPALIISLLAAGLCIFFLFIFLTIKRKPEGAEGSQSDLEAGTRSRSSALVIKLIRLAFMATAVLVTFMHIFYKALLPKTSLIYYIFEGNWDKGVNIFSFTWCIVMICEAFVLIRLASSLLDMTAGVLSKRGVTVCRLLKSMISYLGIIILIFMCIASYGVNMRTLAVSAGILTTVLGLGANSLLTDIFAGLFITFEGDLQVGDAMILDGFLGRITEIGIRTTKIMDTDGNRVIINNSNLHGPVKRARRYNYCHSYIDMDYDESLDRVEAFLAAELPLLRDKLPFLLSEPEYRGVISLLDQRMRIDIRYKASAADRFMAEREMNRELKLIFDKYHLSLNITEDYRMTDIVYLPAGEGDPEAAKAFLEERWKNKKS